MARTAYSETSVSWSRSENSVFSAFACWRKSCTSFACLRRRLMSITATAAMPIAATGRATITAPPEKAKLIARSASRKPITIRLVGDMPAWYPPRHARKRRPGARPPQAERTDLPVAGGRPRAAGLAVGEAPVPAHVAVLAPGDQIHGGLVAHVPDLAHGGRVHARQAARTEHVRVVLVEGDLDPAAVHEVQLLLLLVEVTAGLDARRQLDRVHPEGGHPELAAHLSKAGTLGQRVHVCHREAVA